MEKDEIPLAVRSMRRFFFMKDPYLRVDEIFDAATKEK